MENLCFDDDDGVEILETINSPREDKKISMLDKFKNVFSDAFDDVKMKTATDKDKEQPEPVSIKSQRYKTKNEFRDLMCKGPIYNH